MTKQEIIMELMLISHSVTEGMIDEVTAIEMVDDILERATSLEDNEIITYFSPFTNEPFMIEDNEKQYLLKVKNVIIKEDNK